jgi:hypothetical protein
MHAADSTGGTRLITPFDAGSERLWGLSAELIALLLDATLRDVQAAAFDVEG